MTKTNEIATQTSQVELNSPSDIMGFATHLKELIVQNKLFTNIKGKNYVNVEGWQIAGAFTGTYPIVEKVEQLPTPSGEYKYRAEVSLRNEQDNIVGYGVALCSNKEKGKKDFDEYAVASMAQTRAVGKAYRMKIGWLLKVAGYETTPAEEMDAVKEAQVVEDEKKKPAMREISYAISSLEQATTIEDLRIIWNNLGELQKVPEILAKTNELKAKLSERSENEQNQEG